MKIKAWDLYNSMFKDGDEVIMLDEDDYFHWGVLKSTDKYCILTRPTTGKVEKFEWDEVRFIAREGFPIKRLTGVDGSKLIETLDTTDIQRFLREVLVSVICDKCGIRIDATPDSHEGYVISSPRGSYNYYRCSDCKKKRRAVVGDPYLLEDFSCCLLNPGNSWPKEQYWNKWQWDYEEVMVMRHKGGAQGLLWDIPTIYHFE